ncbi:XRE family transcriptional regulator [Nesterenkonia halophila]
MDQEIAPLAQAVGQRVRQERQAHGWTLDRLAELSGVSRRMLVTVEQGAANASMATLLSLSDALGIGLPALVEPPHGSGTRRTPAGEGAVLWRGPHGGQGVLVAGTEPPDVVELWDWTMHPQEEHRSPAHAAGTRELLHVLAGALGVEVGEARHELVAGDALSFAGDVDHAYAAGGDEPARFALTVFEPGVGPRHGRGGGTR